MATFNFSGAFSIGGTSKRDTFGQKVGRNEKVPPHTYDVNFVNKPKLTYDIVFGSQSKDYDKVYNISGSKKNRKNEDDEDYDEKGEIDENQEKPFNYQIKSDIELAVEKNQGKTFAAKRFDKKKKFNKFVEHKIREEETLVGPGSYKNPFVNKPNTQCYAFSYKQKNAWENANCRLVPGPGAYYKSKGEDNDKQPQKSLLRQTQQSTFSRALTAQSQSQRQQIPGPGNYNPSFTQIFSSPSVKFGGKYNDSKLKQLAADKNGPGPGHYTINNKLFSQIAYSMKSKPESKILKRPKKIESQQQWSQQLQTLPNPKEPKNYIAKSFGTEQRQFQFGNKDQNPGPGSFDVQYPARNNFQYTFGGGKQFSMIQSEKERIPGPGSYDIISKKNGKAYGMRGKGLKSFSIFDIETPGPGKYDIKHDICYSKSPGFAQSKSKRFPDSTSDTPGPEYNITRELKTTTQGFYKKQRPRNKLYKQELPGPGYYQIPSSIGNIPRYLVKSQSKDLGKYSTYINFL